ncbi:unnamed protein product [Didymodactylos carnosus]|uniref:non-specific protein-tyrosine kinase n=1 Tax=Didymodactylos carnosus TaxID=1234261 RepID=A0A813YLP8_9BILA|nr:unnamed protein product [Didymodactylos carnosus]CAF0886084.1 unnamed protein product [Didymodactylos carnosus]CAF3526898.1 unnamed protein product [Didymodactylos carnosus]CAF3671323.1 unnamed protein product [Didymodactylos carnosus]
MELIQLVLQGPRLSQYDLFYGLSFSLRISFLNTTNKAASHKNALRTSTSSSVKTIDEKWLHPDMTMNKIQKTYGPVNELKFELRLRYFPQSIETITHDKTTFGYFYEQLRIDYLRTKSGLGTTSDIIELGCLEIRKLFKDLNPTALDKKINVDYLEKEIGLRKFFPETILNSYKSAKMTSFENILAILTTKSPIDHRGLMKLTVSGISEPLTFTFSSLSDANDVAILIDGYCMLVNRKTVSIWRLIDNESKTSRSCISPPPFLAPHPLLLINSSDHLNDKDSNVNNNKNSNSQSALSFISQHDEHEDDDELNGDYAAILAPNYQIDRKQIQMIEALGHGQFGDVYRGILKTNRQIELDVAVKTCKEQDSLTTEKFLEEAYVMQKFDHPHIIKLIGICTTHPILLIMELAKLGELRSYLVANRNDFDVITLLVYCQQLSSSLSYLETKKFVHRDIAARNVLVSNHECVKLSDFGLSREIDNSYYKASKGKLLPVKWMAPESSIPNSEVIDKIENGERLPMPSPYCPPKLFELMKECWRYEPSLRPSFTQIEGSIRSILDNERSNVKSFVQFKDRILVPLNKAMPLLQQTPSFDRPLIPVFPSSSSSILLTPTTTSESLSVSFSLSSFHSTSPPSNDPYPSKPPRVSKKDNLLRRYQTINARTGNSYLKQINKESETNSYVTENLIELFHSQTKQIINAVLTLTRQTDGVETAYRQQSETTAVYDDKERMMLVRNVAISVRALLQTLDYAPNEVKEMSEQRYNHFSSLVVSLIESVRQRQYQKTTDLAVDIAKTAKKLFDDILYVFKLIKLSPID